MTMQPDRIKEAQASWGAAVADVGAADSWQQAHQRAQALVQKHYWFEDDSLLFCPTRARDTPFRTSLKDAVSYFVGRDPDHAEDTGFALEPWASVRFDNAGIVCRGDVGLAMGAYYFTRPDGSELHAEYSLVYIVDPAGELKIQLHHSALPYSG